MSGGVLEKDAPTATIYNREWFRSNGSPRPERRALRDQLYAEVRAQFPEARQDARALVLAGASGAGKRERSGGGAGGGDIPVRER